MGNAGVLAIKPTGLVPTVVAFVVGSSGGTALGGRCPALPSHTTTSAATVVAIRPTILYCDSAFG